MAKNTIRINDRLALQDEHVVATGQTLTPGNFVKLGSAGTLTQTGVGDVSTGMIVIENELLGKGITDTYAATEIAQVWTATRGDIVYALVPASEVVVIGSKMCLGASGLLEVLDSTATVVVGIALEAVTAGSAASARVLVKLI